MCGIVGYIGKEKKAIEVLINGLEHLEYRGYDSSGIAYVLNNNIVVKKEVGRIEELKKKINFSDQTNIGIGHTRWATHGKPNKVNSHPHTQGKITIVHNGIIENYLELKQKLIEEGYKFLSDTDTEVAAALLNKFYKQTSSMLEAIKLFKKNVAGAYAIAIICHDKQDELYAIKKNSPLIIGIGTAANYLASDVPAIINYTNKYITLDDGYFAKISENNIELYDEFNKKIALKIQEFDGDECSIDKNRYEHYMLKEIYEEPEVVKKSIKIA